MATSLLIELQKEWDSLKAKLDAPSRVRRKPVTLLKRLLKRCIEAGRETSEPGERVRLQWIAREIGDAVFTATLEYPDTIIAPAAAPTATLEGVTLARDPQLVAAERRYRQL